MAEFNGKNGHWVTTKEGKHLFIEEDSVSMRDRQIKERTQQTKLYTMQQNMASPSVDYSKAGSKDAAVAQFEKDTGIKITFDYNDNNVITKTNLYMVLNTVAEMKSRYPQQLQWLQSVGSFNDPPDAQGGLAMARASTSNVIEFNEYVFSKHYPQVESMYKMSTMGSNPYHPKGTTAKDIITHELGHIMFSGYIRRMNRRLTKHDPFDLYDVSAWVRNQGGGSGTTATHIKNKINQALTNALGKTPQHNVLGYANPRHKNAIAISGYASTNIHELMAESVADWVANGNNASPLSKELVKILHL